MRQWWVYINGEQSVYSDNGDWSDSSVATKFGIYGAFIGTNV
jgi:hypothetical protein